MPSRPDVGAGTPSSNDRRNPYVFAVGCPRSGTTMLQRMLDSHPLLAVANDSHFIPRVVSDLPLDSDPALTPDLVEAVRGYRRFYRLGLSDEAVDEAAASSTTYAGFVGALYAEYGRQRGKELAGEKTPDYVRSLPRLTSLFPWARAVHIIRDGREVALSTLEWAKDGKGPSKLAMWAEEPVAVCALWWRWQVGTGRRDGARVGPACYREVHYEDLVARPEESLRGLADFLDLPYAPQMATYYVGKTVQRPGLSAKKAWLPPTAGLRDWHDGMSEADLEMFEVLAGDLLSDLGYELGVPSASPGVRARAERVRAWWDGLGRD